MIWQALLLLAPALPLALALLAVVPRVRRTVLPPLLPFAPAPAMVAALLAPEGTAAPLPDMLLGAALALDGPGRIFLGAAALLWCLAGVYVRGYMGPEKLGRFSGFWLATLAGNLGVFVAADAVAFYLAYALLSLAAFGLVIHAGTDEARRAAVIYLILAVIGEVALMMGLLVGATEASSLQIPDVRQAIAASPMRDLAVALLVVGLGLKAGLMPLHVWLPLAHPAAPTPASAVLSGAIVKAGIFGLIQFLPLEATLPAWSALLVAAGLATAYLGVLFGLVQPRLKTTLAYSTLSQMGLVIVVLGAALAEIGPGAAIAAATLYAAHHGLAKGALFLSVGVVPLAQGTARRALLAVAAVAALAVGGLPFTGGALAKLAIKGPVGETLAGFLVALSAAGTTLLMLRFLQLLRRERAAEPGRPPIAMTAPFLLAALAALTLPWLLFPNLTTYTLGYALGPANLWGAAWPVLVGAAIAFGALRLRRVPTLRIPEGDIVAPLEALALRAPAAARALSQARPRPARVRSATAADPLPARIDLQAARWPVPATLLLALAAAVFAALRA